MMKKTRHIDLSLLRKQVRKFSLAPLTVGVAAALAGCSGEPQERVKVVSSVDDCVGQTELSVEQCQAAYQEALAEAERTGPRYQHQYLCEADFGQCQQSSSGFFTPFITGYIVAEIIDEVGDAFERKHRRRYNPVYTYQKSGSKHRQKIMTADGTILGSAGKSSYKVPSSVTKPKPAVTRTISRGGFGAQASAKSNWGGGKSSSRGWGG